LKPVWRTRRGMRIALLATAVAVTSWGCAREATQPTWTPGGSFLTQHQQTPDWSKQGLIAYVDRGVTAMSATGFGYHVDTTLAGIWVIDPDSGEKHRLLPFGLCPSWSPDGQRIAFQYSHTIFQARIDGTEILQLTDARRECYLPAWSPDGNWIAYDAEGGIWRVLAEGGLNYTVGEPYRAKNPCWSPDGASILHDRVPKDGSMDASLFLVFIDDEHLQPIVPTPRAPTAFRETWGAFSPSGDRIAFVVQQNNPPTEVWIMNADGSGAVQLTTGGGYQPSWSPDGKRIVYNRPAYGPYDPEKGVLWIADLETGEHWQLTHHWPLTFTE
jgi:Tol biopolymer transport system component